MIVPLDDANNPNLTAWSMCCNRCSTRTPIDRASDWLCADVELGFDFDLCKPCTDAAALEILRAALFANRPARGLAARLRQRFGGEK